MLFNLQKCLIMHSGFEETGLQVRLRGKLLRQRRIKRIWIHVVMQNALPAMPFQHHRNYYLLLYIEILVFTVIMIVGED